MPRVDEENARAGCTPPNGERGLVGKWTCTFLDDMKKTCFSPAPAHSWWAHAWVGGGGEE